MTAYPATIFQRDPARRLRSQGKSLRVISKEIGDSHYGIDVMSHGQSLRPRPGAWIPRKDVVRADGREEIPIGPRSGFFNEADRQNLR